MSNGKKWTPERRRKFAATLARKKNAQQERPDTGTERTTMSVSDCIRTIERGLEELKRILGS
jgi:hypothetical protein